MKIVLDSQPVGTPMYVKNIHACNLFQVRQQGRMALQQALWERSEGRHRARTIAPMAANLSSILMADLDIVKGKLVPYASVGKWDKLMSCTAVIFGHCIIT